MHTIRASLVRQDRGPTTQESPGRHGDLVLPGAGLLIVVFLAFRAWTLFPSWFYADDQRLLIDAREKNLDLAYLTTPFDSQFMPLGRLIASIVAGSPDEPPSWTLAAVITLCMLALAGAACLAMLVVAFGRRWEVLALLALFLTSTTALPASMWWAASLNQLPLLIVWCGAVASGLLVLRTRRPVWVACLAACLALGLLAYIKTLLVVPVLAWLSLAYFARGSVRPRLLSVLRQFWWLVVPLVVASVGVAVAYRAAIPQPFTEDSVLGVAGPLADRLIGTSWATSALGGPWRWGNNNPPVGVTDPPNWSVHLSWVLLVLTVCYAALRRRRTGRAWALLAICVLLDYLLLLTTRAPFFGAIAGNEMRYLTESSAALCLVLGLVFLPLRGAVESSEPRERPLLSLALTPLSAVVLSGAIVLGSVLTSVAYVRTWHTNNPGQDYLTRVADSARALGSVDLVDATVPDEVMAPYTFPYNQLSSLVPLRSAYVEFPEVTRELSVVSESGAIVPAKISPVVLARRGPLSGCGWRVKKDPVAVPLTRTTPEGDWWMSIGYLATDASTVEVEAGTTTIRSTVMSGLGTLYIRVPGSFDEVTFAPPDDGTTLCIDRIAVGPPVAGDS